MRTPRRLDKNALWEYALRTLASRAQSIADLRSKLLRKAFAPEDAEDVLSRLKQRGVLNDQRFAESYATARLENQGLGKQRVLRDLRQRRVPSRVAEQAVNEAFAEVDEPALIERFLERKCKRDDLADPRKLASAYRRLRYAGFSSGNSIRVLKQFSESADELASIEEDVPPPEP